MNDSRDRLTVIGDALNNFLAGRKQDALRAEGVKYLSALVDELRLELKKCTEGAAVVNEVVRVAGSYGNYGENFSNYAENFSNYAENFSNYAENFSNYAQSLEANTCSAGLSGSLAELRRKSQQNAGLPGRLPNGDLIPPIIKD